MGAKNSVSGDHKIKTTVGFTPRQDTGIKIEAKRLGLSFSDVVRRWIDEKLDLVRPSTTSQVTRDPRAQRLYEK